MAKEKEKPLTREDVLKAIEENGGTAEGLDLSDCKFIDNVDLSGLELSGIVLNKAKLFRANFNGSILDRASMQRANLQYATFNPFETKVTSLVVVDFRNAHLENAQFREAELTDAFFQGETGHLSAEYLEYNDFRGANLWFTDFSGCRFYGTKLEGAYIRAARINDAHLEDTNWGSYKIGEENKKEELHFAETAYRRLKMWYSNAGMNDIAAKFYYREKEAARKSLIFYYIDDEVGNKSLKLLPKNWKHRIALQLSYWVFGHGEGWKRLLFWVAGFILLFALIYFVFDSTRQWQYFGDYLYFSAVSFTALGYGSWLNVANNWIKGIGAFESLIGVFSMALLLVTFVRKWTR